MTIQKHMKPDTNPTKPKQTAKNFLDELISTQSTLQDNARFYKGDNNKNKFLGLRMASIFSHAKLYTQMPLNELEKLLENDNYEARIGAVSIMDFQARDKKLNADRKKGLYELYIRRHDRIDNWDMVDRGAPYIVGGYLFNKSREPLYKLAKSKNIWERRTAIVSTYFFIRQNDIDDTFKIAGILVNDKQELINMAVGGWIREAGKRDEAKLLKFLDTYSATMPRMTIRYAIEKLDIKLKEKYMNRS
jgi:3-methyladenine DNA glycosylase AlkD